jgi:hypothetical protein
LDGNVVQLLIFGLRYVFATFQNNILIDNIKNLTASDPTNQTELMDIEFQKAQARTIPTYGLAIVAPSILC